MSDYHIPVLLHESVEGLNIISGGIYVDVTYGGGGHSAEILKKLGSGKLFAFDQDEDAAANIPQDDRFLFIQGNFRFLKNYLHYYGVKIIDGLIADLGVSSHHFDTPDRGFTYRYDTALDMRMNRLGNLTAERVINEYDIDSLTSLLQEYGELPHAHRLAAAIGNFRLKKRIKTTSELVGCLEPHIPRHAENQFLSKVFQAIRIEVNREMESLKEMLSGAAEMLRPHGRLVVISYHSLEDRIVKNFMRWGNNIGQPEKDIYGHRDEPFRLVTRKPVMAGDQETAHNPRSRSARLRIAEKLI